MELSDLDLEKIDAAERRVESSLRDKEGALAGAKQQICTLRKTDRELENTITNRKLEKELLRKARVITRGLGPTIAPLRQTIIDKATEAYRDDITVAKVRELNREVEDLKTKLREECTHLFFVGRHGHDNYYEGYWTPSRRECLACGLNEDAEGHGTRDGEQFKVIADSVERIEGNLYCFKLKSIWIPFEEILALFLDERMLQVINGEELNYRSLFS